MDLLPVGDRYIWYCDWCDTKNVTPWVRVRGKEVCCAACHKSFPNSRSKGRGREVAHTPVGGTL